MILRKNVNKYKTINGRIYSTVKGGALYYVVFISYIIISFLILLISYRAIKLRFIQNELEYFDASDNLRSALTLYLSYPERYQEMDSVNLDVFSDSTSIVKIRKEAWGILDILHASTRYRDTSMRKSVIAGKDPFNGDSVALWIPDNSQNIFASGETLIKGNVKLPSKGIQKASIEGHQFAFEQLIHGRILPGEPDLFELDSKLIKKIKIWQNFDSISIFNPVVNQIYESSMSISYTLEPLIYFNSESFELSCIDAKGKILFLTPSMIIVRNDAILDGIILSAGKVFIEDGFRGSLQIFATDTVIIGSNCTLKYPSALVLFNQNHNPVYVEIGESSTLDGVIIINQTLLSTKEPFLKISKGSQITGQIYLNGNIQLIGKIFGSLICKSFYLTTRKAYYINHLLDNEINFLKMPTSFVGVDFKYGYNDQIIEFLEETL
jgi:hypothetical protein